MIDPASPRLQHRFTPPTPIPGITFRLAQTLDLKALQENCYPETDWQQFQDHYSYLIKWQENDRCAILIAETAVSSPVNGIGNSSIPDLPNRPTNLPEIIGSGQLIRQQDTAEIAELVVCATYQNQGIGTAMIHILTQIALEQKISMLEIGVAVDNQAARRLYRRLGFGDERLIRIPGFQDAIVLRKNLAQRRDSKFASSLGGTEDFR